MGVRELHQRATDAIVRIANTVTPGDLSLPTPCDEWTVRALLEHQVAQNVGFAFAASGERSELDFWQPRELADPVASHAASAATVVAAFAADGVLDRRFWLPEIRDGGPFPASTAIGAHFLDCVVHAWDLASALGAPYTVDDELAEAALPIALRVPDSPDTRGSGRAFQPTVAVPPDAPPLDRVVAALGRQPR